MDIIEYIKSFFKKEQDDPTKLRIKIPKCTFIRCFKCKGYFIKEHDLYCPCLKKNEEEQRFL